ncbi:MAG TPA: TRL domain-containing protein [Cyclobacteriaceae bacterium]|nr:TRL domain-containing protein [Cyclobacteriaceae bacterium]
MKQCVNLILVGLMCFLLVGCMGAASLQQPNASFAVAGIYTDVQGGSLVLDNGVAATKTGTACSHQILGILASGDTRVETAMANGGISKLVYVNTSYKNIVWGVYTEVCTIARGN